MKIKIALLAGLILLFIFLLKVYGVVTGPDTQCTSSHVAKTNPPLNLKTAQDFFTLGDYNYELGKCDEAIAAYTEAIDLNPKYAQAYNNRAYTNMRLHNYKDALPDLEKAIFLNPNYAVALMNRGDIYNYYYAIDRKRAIADYQRVITLGQDKDPSGSVCGHMAMAKTNNLIPLAFLRLLTHVDCK